MGSSGLYPFPQEVWQNLWRPPWIVGGFAEAFSDHTGAEVDGVVEAEVPKTLEHQVRLGAVHRPAVGSRVAARVLVAA